MNLRNIGFAPCRKCSMSTSGFFVCNFSNDYYFWHYSPREYANFTHLKFIQFFYAFATSFFIRYQFENGRYCFMRLRWERLRKFGAAGLWSLAATGCVCRVWTVFLNILSEKQFKKIRWYQLIAAVTIISSYVPLILLSNTNTTLNVWESFSSAEELGCLWFAPNCVWLFLLYGTVCRRDVAATMTTAERP